MNKPTAAANLAPPSHPALLLALSAWTVAELEARQRRTRKAVRRA